MELLRQQFTDVLEALSNHMEWCHNPIHNVLSFSDKVIIKGVLARTEKKFRAQTCSNVVSCDINWAVPVCLSSLSVSNWSAKDMLLALFYTIFWNKRVLKRKKKNNLKGLKFQSETPMFPHHSPFLHFLLIQLLAGIIDRKSTDLGFSVKSIKYCFKKWS